MPYNYLYFINSQLKELAATEAARPINTVSRNAPKKQLSLNANDDLQGTPQNAPSSTAAADAAASLARRASHRDHTKTSTLSLSSTIAGGQQSDSAGSTGSLKRLPYNKINNVNVMGKIKDRTGVPV